MLVRRCARALAATTGLAVALVACNDDNVGPPPIDPSAPALVTRHGGDRPTVSGDGQWIAFELPTPHHFFVGRIRPNGTGLDTLTFFCSQNPDWARTSNLIVFQCGGTLYTVDAASHQYQDLTFTGFQGAPAWSPTGTRLALKSDGGIVVFTYPGGQRTDVPCTDPDAGPCAGEDPAWSPDGLWITFDDGDRILKVSATGGLAQVLVEGMGDVGEPAWSRDGRWLAFTRIVSTGTPARSEIWVADTAHPSSAAQQITRDANDRSPAWAPGASTLYFASDRTGRPEIWQVAFAPPPPQGPSYQRKRASLRVGVSAERFRSPAPRTGS